MTVIRSLLIFMIVSFFTAGAAFALTEASFDVKNSKNIEMNKKCITCHLKENKSLVLQWERSAHAAAKEGQVGCYTCHAANTGDEMGYTHEGAFIKAVLTPNDCAKCHEPEATGMSVSHHATAGEIMASLDNMLAEVIGGMPTNKGNMNSGCWQCHGSVVSLKRDKDGKPMRSKPMPPRWITIPIPIQVLAESILMVPRVSAMPVIPSILFLHPEPDSLKTAANVILALIIRKKRSMKSPNMALPISQLTRAILQMA